MGKVAIVTYSMYGHINAMAEEEKKGLEEAGCEVTIFRVPETLPEEVLAKMHAPPKPDYPVVTAEQLVDFDGIMFGIPTRFGMACAQMKSFLDSTGGLWIKQALSGKPAAIFVSTSTQGGGQESTALTWVTQLTHHGMIFCPLGYGSPGTQYNMDAVQGGSPWGAGTFAGPDGSRMPSDNEKKTAATQGKLFGGVVQKLSS
ncbi:flavoprotein YCP4 [Sphaeroforma arctica JP610]|uniref:Flavoprotein YCP4 n=1 Tax=Sphaeroforma arctica JP610 TaxID=667725 RepID=A0A0L0FHS9_9EUKA|nr:flavoprotein YCP4 [Sphaeroforma arctica JP610]KNC76342.1 flavoprotein YCP4 [Sphaeroforma arctica JP610]|eukprot:XP_014150244.1 flavoprotein YCP4 [Sphaeroforma arctica JP610]